MLRLNQFMECEKNAKVLLIILFIGGIIFSGCNGEKPEESMMQNNESKRLPVIIDTDANNELDDQHAMAYLFFNDEVFETIGVTVNATRSGGDINDQVAEARRVMHLCGVLDQIPLLAGANGDFATIRPRLQGENFDGQKAVDFIIKEARKEREQPLILLPVGKLTNIALALEKAPDIKDKVRIVWLGSNYPEKGEYNQVNDIPSLNYILDQDVPFEMVMVRYGKPSGSDAVRATPEEIAEKMPDAGPEVDAIEGRHGGYFTNFGDYSVDLFSQIELHGNPPSRALFDMVAVAILKNPDWGKRTEIPAPHLVGEEWVERQDNKRKIAIWEYFNKEKIMNDFYAIMQK